MPYAERRTPHCQTTPLSCILRAGMRGRGSADRPATAEDETTQFGEVNGIRSRTRSGCFRTIRPLARGADRRALRATTNPSARRRRPADSVRRGVVGRETASRPPPPRRPRPCGACRAGGHESPLRGTRMRPSLSSRHEKAHAAFSNDNSRPVESVARGRVTAFA